MISDFSGPHFFLSNFYPSPVTYEGVVYASVEHAFQAAKALDPETRVSIQQAGTPDQAKRLGRRATLRADWEQVKVSIMEQILRQKFTDAQLAESLLATGDEELLEGNTWNDRFWGAVYNYGTRQWEGQNHLGKLLMKLRQELRQRS
jgi:ribA/ribD-fused uncharacterized protein